MEPRQHPPHYAEVDAIHRNSTQIYHKVTFPNEADEVRPDNGKSSSSSSSSLSSCLLLVFFFVLVVFFFIFIFFLVFFCCMTGALL